MTQKNATKLYAKLKRSVKTLGYVSNVKSLVKCIAMKLFFVSFYTQYRRQSSKFGFSCIIQI